MILHLGVTVDPDCEDSDALFSRLEFADVVAPDIERERLGILFQETDVD